MRMAPVEPAEHRPLLAIRGLKKSFGALRAIDDLHLDIASGGIFGVIGPNGSGKTTLFNVISGVRAPTAGAVCYRGVDITGLSSERVARHGIARTFQNLRIFRRLTVLENVMGAQTGSAGMSFLQAAFPHPGLERARRADAMDTLERVGLADRCGVLAQELPLGEQRRLELARAMARKPDLMMLDEPAGGMTPSETDDMAGLIERVAAGGPTVVLIEHKMGMVMSLCRRIAVLNFGRKIAEGTPAQVQRDGAAVEAYLGPGAVHA